MHGRPAQPVHPIEEAPEAEGREQYPQRREHDPWPEDRADVGELRLQPPREEDDRQGEDPKILHTPRIIILNTQSRATEDHTRQEEEQEGRHAEARPHLARQDPSEDEQRAHEEEKLKGEKVQCHLVLFYSLCLHERPRAFNKYKHFGREKQDFARTVPPRQAVQ